MLPTVDIVTALHVGCRLERSRALAEADLGDSRVGHTRRWLIRVFVPATIVGILLQSAGAL